DDNGSTTHANSLSASGSDDPATSAPRRPAGRDPLSRRDGEGGCMSPRLRATFCTAADAQATVERLRQDLPDAVIVVDDEEDRSHMLRRIQQREAERTQPLAVELISPAQA